MVLAVVGANAYADAQPANGDGLGVFEGRIVAAESQRPVQSAFVCARVPANEPRQRYYWPCVDVDTTGRFRIGGLPPGSVPVRVNCHIIASPVIPKRLRRDTVMITSSAPVRREWTVSAKGCDPRERRTVRDTFRGHYTVGFEQSTFVPCPADAWFLPGDSLQAYRSDRRDAWVEFPDWQRMIGRLRSVEAGEDRWGDRYYVRLRGEVVGPGRYGHLGVSVFELRVDSLMEVRTPVPDDCSRYGHE